MLETIGSYLVYLFAFLLGSVLALLAARQLHPAMSEDEALDDLDFGRRGVRR